MIDFEKLTAQMNLSMRVEDWRIMRMLLLATGGPFESMQIIIKAIDELLNKTKIEQSRRLRL